MKRILNFKVVLLIFAICLVGGFTVENIPAFAQEETEEEETEKEAKPSWFDIKYYTTVGYEYESNILLDEDQENSDLKTLITQYISLAIPKEDLFCKFDFIADNVYYQEEAERVESYSFNGLVSLSPSDVFSIGLNNFFSYTPTSKIIAPLGDKLLAMGFQENTTSIESKWRVLDDTVLALTGSLYRLDVKDPDNDDNMDRYVYGVTPTIYQDFTPLIRGYLGFRYEDFDYTQASDKCMDAYKIFTGLTKKIPGFFNVTTEVGFHEFDMDDVVTNGPAENTSDIEASLSFDSTFSLYTKLSLGLIFNQVSASSRSDYAKYHSNSISLALKHYINPKLILFSDVSFEKQKFMGEDVLPGFDQEGRNTDIFSYGITLEKTLNNLLSLDLSYGFSKRNSDFAREGFTDNKVTLSIRANY